MKIFKKSEVQQVADAIMNDGFAIIVPSDTVWALVTNSEAQIYSIKNRPEEKKVSLFIDSLDAVALPSFYKQVLSKYVPGELSFVWKGTNHRIPKNKFLLELLNITGPLFQSSANISGQNPIANIEEGMKIFEGKENLAFVEQTPDDIMSGKSSTIINLDTLKVLRSGVVDGQKIIDEIQKGNQ